MVHADLRCLGRPASCLCLSRAGHRALRAGGGLVPAGALLVDPSLGPHQLRVERTLQALPVVRCIDQWRSAQSQLAIFTFLLATLLAAAGVFSFHYVAAASHWVFEGCVMYRTEGIWSKSRIQEKLQVAHEQYEELSCSYKRCRLLNPLTLDLADCGPRARCKGGSRVDRLRFYGWMRHLQVTFHCGGFCRAEVPMFGLTTMEETLHERPACVDSVVDLLQMAGRLLGAVAVLLAVPVGLAALRLACVAAVEEEEESGSETAPLTSRRTMGPRVHADEDSL
ncbi:unnamed protein product [Durusdinium trenchii]|uniref:Tetraspanin n=1 Tax=Durusdinium trenchii TaxID=1381693 RepID=A0ABP0S7D3_9DINO